MVKLREYNGMFLVENDGNRRENPLLSDRIYGALDGEDSWNYNYSSVNSEENMNKKGFFSEHYMPKGIPSSIKSWDVCLLEKWDYKWIVFDMPWVEVKINWQWIAYDESNAPFIKSQNPMTLEWRISADEAAKFWGENLKLKVIPVDDQWNRLNVGEEINIKIENNSKDE